MCGKKGINGIFKTEISGGKTKISYVNDKKRGDFMKYYNTAEVARELEIPRTTFYRWVKRGLIEPDKVLLSGKKQFSEDTVARLKKGEVICKN